jgi:hypothetical protein
VLLFAIYLVLVIALPVMLSAAIGYHSLPRGHACPNCTQDTFAVQSYFIRMVRLVHPRFRLQRRWCPTCTWDGWARAYQPAPAQALVSSVPTTRQTQPLRTLELGGRCWSVMLEHWRERGRCYGRLLFVGPSGRLWCDPLAAFHGQTQSDVMGQALALSDRLLAYRLREVISG